MPLLDVESSLAGPTGAIRFRAAVRHGKSGVFSVLKPDPEGF